MTQEEKQILIKDLCARLPYETIVNCLGNVLVLKSISYTAKGEVFRLKSRAGISKGSSRVLGISIIKPYLRPMSSMTEEEKREYHKIIIKSQDCSFENNKSATVMVSDWLLSKGFDVRGLIPMGLALEAPEGMYKITH